MLWKRCLSPKAIPSDIIFCLRKARPNPKSGALDETSLSWPPGYAARSHALLLEVLELCFERLHMTAHLRKSLQCWIMLGVPVFLGIFKVDCWFPGLLVRWSAGPPVCWSFGPVRCWSSGPVRCFLRPGSSGWGCNPKRESKGGDVIHAGMLLFANGGGGGGGAATPPRLLHFL